MNAVHFQVTDILTQVFNTLLVAEVRNDRRRCSPSLALLYVQFVWFGCNRLIGTGLRIEIRECDSRNFEIACITRDGHIFDRLRTGSSCRGSLDVHFHLRIINVEIVRESDFRILYQLDVSITGNLHLHGNGIICLYIIGTDAGGHCEIAYRTGERRRFTRRQRLDIDRYRGRCQFFLYIYIRRRTEEIIEYTASLSGRSGHTQNNIQFPGRDRNLP